MFQWLLANDPFIYISIHNITKISDALNVDDKNIFPSLSLLSLYLCSLLFFNVCQDFFCLFHFEVFASILGFEGVRESLTVGKKFVRGCMIVFELVFQLINSSKRFSELLMFLHDKFYTPTRPFFIFMFLFLFFLP